jgi:hypothetical protein
MGRLLASIEGRSKRNPKGDAAGGEEKSTNIERHPLGMFGLVSGVWLGDAFVREAIPPSLSRARALRDNRRRGFGKKNADAYPMVDRRDDDDDGMIEVDRFAVWHLGVQKVALRFECDYRDGITQSYTYGRVMGTPTSLKSMAIIKSDGVVVLNESKRASTKTRENRRVIWDMDGGMYVAGIIGSRYFRAPRYMSFSRSRSYSSDAYLTEFMVFYRPDSMHDVSYYSSDGGINVKDLDVSINEDGGLEYYCSRISRLCNAIDGNLLQGSTAFFSLKRTLSEK